MSNIEQDCVTFRMRDEEGNELHFKVSMGIKLQKVFDVYASKKNLTVSSLKFLFNAERVIGDMTPETLGNEEIEYLTTSNHMTSHVILTLLCTSNSFRLYLLIFYLWSSDRISHFYWSSSLLGLEDNDVIDAMSGASALSLPSLVFVPGTICGVNGPDPDALGECTEQMKLTIVRHRMVFYPS